MSKQDEKKLYEQQENRILAQSDAFISLLTKRGILGDQKLMMRRCVLPEGEKAECLSQYPDAPQKLQENGLGVQLLPGGDFAGTGGSV